MNLKNIILPFFVSLLPFALITGPFFSDFIVSLSSLIFLIYVFKYKAFDYINKKPLIFFFIFCFYCILLSIFVAKDILLSLKSSLFYFRIGVFSCLVWHLIERDKKILDYFYYAFILCFLALVIDGYYQYFTGYNITGLKVAGIRVSSFFGDELIMGGYLSRLYPLTFALLLLRRQNKLELNFVTILLILTSGLIYISGERTAFFLHLLSLIFIFLLLKKLNFLKFLLLTGFIGIIITFSLNNIDLRYRMFQTPFKGIIAGKENQYIFTPAHDSLIGTAYNMFLDKPVFGHGPKMFRVICKDEKYVTGVTTCRSHPHNFYIQLLAETGIIGFLFLLSAFLYVIYCALRQFKTIIFKEQRYLTDYQVCLLACILITVWPLSPNGNFFNNWLIICYSLPIGFYLYSIYGKNRKEIFKE